MPETEEVLASMREWATDPNLQNITEEELNITIEYCKCNLGDWPPGHFRFGEALAQIRKDLKRKQEMEALKKALPLPISETEQALQRGIEFCRRIKRENPELDWIEISKLMQKEGVVSFSK